MSVTEGGRKRPNYTLDSDINGEMTLQDLLEWTKAALIVTADSVLKDAQKNDGFPEDPVLVVDGKQGKNPKDVHPLGSIQFVAKQDFGPILVEAYAGILKRSKIKTGRYISSHYVFHQGNQVANDEATLKAWLATNPVFRDNDTIRIVNIQPYARRLEMLGVTAQRTQNRIAKPRPGSKKRSGTMVKMPNGAYQLTARQIKSKYKNNLGIKFTFLPGSSMGLTASFAKRPRDKGKRKTYLYPSIVFTISSRGIKNV